MLVPEIRNNHDLDIATLTEQLSIPFTQQDRLFDLRRRKDEINAQLTRNLLEDSDELDAITVVDVTESEEVS